MPVIRTIITKIKQPITMWAAALKTCLVRTNKKQWRKVAHGGRPSWDSRNEIIGKLVEKNSTVLDIGCGAQTLKTYLPVGCEYQPCDLIKSSADVIVCDFNAGQYPKVSKAYDYVICSGVLEYMRSPRTFISQVTRLGANTLISYNPLYPGDSKVKRLGNGWGWVNHFSTSELEDLFVELGLNWQNVYVSPDAYIIYKLVKDGTAYPLGMGKGAKPKAHGHNHAAD